MGVSSEVACTNTIRMLPTARYFHAITAASVSVFSLTNRVSKGSIEAMRAERTARSNPSTRFRLWARPSGPATSGVPSLATPAALSATRAISFFSRARLAKNSLQAGGGRRNSLPENPSCTPPARQHAHLVPIAVRACVSGPLAVAPTRTSTRQPTNLLTYGIGLRIYTVRYEKNIRV